MNKTLTCVILEDEPDAMYLLKKYVEEEKALTLQHTFQGASEAKKYLLEQDVDLLIADINLPDQNAFQLVGELPRKPMIILCTGNNNVVYATKGYRLDVVDYLTKPFLHSDFKEAIGKALRKKNSLPPMDGPIWGHMVLEQDGGVVQVFFADVIYLEVNKNYVYVYLLGQEPVMVRKTLREMQHILPEGRFVQVHKSYLVARHRIRQVLKSQVYMYHNSVKLPLGRAFKEEVMAYLRNRDLN